jgi:nitronate monooxygenase
MAEPMPASGKATRSWKSTRVTRLLEIDYPIVQAPFGGLPSQRLTAAVSNLGGMGSFGAVTLNGSAIREAIAEIRSLTAKPFAVNLWVSTFDRELSNIGNDLIERRIHGYLQYYAELGVEPPSQLEARHPDFDAQVRAAMDAGVPVLSFIYGIPPSEVLDECRRQSIRTIATATTAEEAIALEQAGIELIVATGFEGGGHRASFLRPAAQSLIGSLSLIPQVADAVDVPVIAAGGIADGRGLAAALALGAEGVQIGTAFLPCDGSGACEAYRAAFSAYASNGTGLTDALTGRLARAIRNRLTDELTQADSSPLPFPLQHTLLRPLAEAAARQKRFDLMPFWAGQSVGLCHSTQASELMSKLIAETDTIFSRC